MAGWFSGFAAEIAIHSFAETTNLLFHLQSKQRHYFADKLQKSRETKHDFGWRFREHKSCAFHLRNSGPRSESI